MHTYQSLYVISDLHLGGSQESSSSARGPIPVQACGRGNRLAAWIRSLCPRAKREQVGLVINGDFVDFLAENPTQHLDPVSPQEHLRRVAGDAAFSAVFLALRDFVACDGARLVIVIGNHDVELLVPETQRALGELLGWPSHDRLEYALDGTGYTCQVGGRVVYCTHGNEHDPWNALDQRAIRRLLRAVKRGEVPRRDALAAVSNAGTRLVVEVMNDFKRSYPFVDLLKPEAEAVLPLLEEIVRNEADRRRVRVGWRLPARLAVDSVRVRGGLLSEAPADDLESEGPALEAAPRVDWDEVERCYQRGEDVLALANAESGETLGIADAVRGIVGNRLTGRGLRGYFEKLIANDRTFFADEPDDTFRALDREVDPRVDFIVAGHTHLARLLPRQNGNGYYLNSGTWMRLLRLSSAIVREEAAWSEVREVLTSRDVTTMEQWMWKGAPNHTSDQDRRLFLDRCTVVQIVHDASKKIVHGKLCVVRDDDGQGGKVCLVREPTFGPKPVSLSALRGAP